MNTRYQKWVKHEKTQEILGFFDGFNKFEVNL
jgi:hypothetical protein